MLYTEDISNEEIDGNKKRTIIFATTKEQLKFLEQSKILNT